MYKNRYQRNVGTIQPDNNINYYLLYMSRICCKPSANGNINTIWIAPPKYESNNTNDNVTMLQEYTTNSDKKIYVAAVQPDDKCSTQRQWNAASRPDYNRRTVAQSISHSQTFPPSDTGLNAFISTVVNWLALHPGPGLARGSDRATWKPAASGPARPRKTSTECR